MNNIRKAVAFVRTANQEQNEQSESLQKQIVELIKCANERELELARVFKLVGRTDQHLLKVLEYCQKNKDIWCVLVTGPDRISRNPCEVLYWQRMFDLHDIRFQSSKSHKNKMGFNPAKNCK